MGPKKLTMWLRFSWQKGLQVGLGLALALFFLKWINIGESWRYLAEIRPWPFVATCLLGILGTTIRSFRFYALVRAVRSPMTLTQSIFSNYIASFLAIVTPARAGEGGKILFFDNKKNLAACFIFEKLADFGLLVLAGVYGMLMFQRYMGGFAILLIIIVLGVMALFNAERILNFVLRRNIFKERWLWPIAQQISTGSWFIFLAHTIGIWFIGILAQVVGATALNLTIPIPLIIQVSALTTLAGVLSGIPGGIGPSQFVFTTLLAENMPVDHQRLGILSIIILLAAYITALAQGGIGLLMYRLRAKDTIRAKV
ncbi:MAG: flippase-like domain-containing protein [Anaerolineae bacterium]|nr:flippase-like domain-containing protein [Anaerolineae bacterium]